MKMHVDAPTYYLLRVNKKDIELYKNSDIKYLFFIVTEIIKNKYGLIKIGNHGYCKAKIIIQSFDKNKLIAYTLKNYPQAK